MFKKRVRCDFCSTELTNEKCYTVRGKMVEGLAAALSSTLEPTLYDAVDCPKCGKQEIVGIRERAITNRQEKKCEDNSIIRDNSNAIDTEHEC